MDSTKKPLKRNPVWKNALQEQNLCEEINKFGSLENEHDELVKIDRGVESYKYSKDEFIVGDDKSACRNHLSGTKTDDPESNGGDQERKLEERLGEAVTFDANKPRSHILVNEFHPEQVVVKEIARQLSENNIEIISRCVKVLGRKKSLELLYATQDLEQTGGMFTSDGFRRRSPGGVYLQLIKRDDSILSLQKKQIFIEDEDKKKKKKAVKRLKQRAKFDIAKKILEEQVKRDSQKAAGDRSVISNENESASNENGEEDDMADIQEDAMIYFED